MANDRHTNVGSDNEDVVFTGRVFRQSSGNCSSEHKSGISRGPTTPAKPQTKPRSYSEDGRPRSAGDIFTPRGGKWEQIIDEHGNNI